MNFALGILFVAFALSLFGMFDLTLPAFLTDFTSSREGKGGYAGTIFMALSFSIVSFTCVAPFLGGLSSLTTSGNFSTVQLLAGAFAFSGTFAAPFFLLALFPSLLKKLPKSGNWMTTIKVAMGFLELAAALKFFRTAELRWGEPPAAVFSYDFVLSCWVVLLVMAGLYLMGFYRFPHDEPREHPPGVSRILTGMLAVALGLYLVPGLFAKGPHGERNRPVGTFFAWVDSFLLPDSAETPGLIWSGDLKGAVERARSRGKLVFVDFTGVTCTNCRLNEQGVFARGDVAELLKEYQLVQVYTDEVPPQLYQSSPASDRREQDAKAGADFQRKAFGTSQLPLYVVLRPEVGGTTRVAGVYAEGKINDADGFKQFLRKPLNVK